ncbi:hypothetical protein [Phycicoccus sp.]|uniref:hypothetical protein n=1 Tax=Phycicoccus sp. TaxID=1902410 RepID=UPI002C604B05|nr:hypothetical protein [Phycicoccus sp.]HMM96713.1 hypothetical protein [Phycicoccus sp.]
MALNVFLHLNGVDYRLLWTVEHESDPQVASLTRQLVGAGGSLQRVDVEVDGRRLSLLVHPDRLWAAGVSVAPETAPVAEPLIARGHGTGEGATGGF